MAGQRGQPARIQPKQYTRLIVVLRDSPTIAAAAAAMKVDPSTIYRLLKREPVLAQMAAAARAIAAGDKPTPQREICGTESRYVLEGCRCTDCTEAATLARAKRRQNLAAVYDSVVPMPIRREDAA
ncbi:hypothetical protein [Streptomyces sp. NRRL S-350]|uniref:hypothetical protein n=1 Tax=Streptomyces sp. NRRL S-350 TaxID=1463902 RepID=UPI0004C20E42|nr:hypothetical protein [Streptomyces sp. NRRL S-350]